MDSLNVHQEVDYKIFKNCERISRTVLNDSCPENEQGNNYYSLQKEKYESLGQLAAGIIHEINTPVQYIGDSISFLKFLSKIVKKIISELRYFIEKNDSDKYLHSKFEDILRLYDYEFICNEYQSAFIRIDEGLDYIRSIIFALNRYTFCSACAKDLVDVIELIRDMVLITKPEWKYCSDIKINADCESFFLKCYQGDMRQVLLNLIVNAAHSINDVYSKAKTKGLIEISVSKSDSCLRISVGDNGAGIEDSIKDKIFQRYFTTKKQGLGTGQGLSLVRDIVVNKHNGAVSFESRVGHGSVFCIEIPVY